MACIYDLVKHQETYRADVTQTVLELAQAMVDRNIGAVPVLRDGEMVGIFSERDLMTRVVVLDLDPRLLLVREVMTRDLIVAEDDESIEVAEAKMTQRGCRHLPVLHEGRLLGFLSLRDLMGVDLETKSQELAIMTHYVQWAPPEVEARLRDALH